MTKYQGCGFSFKLLISKIQRFALLTKMGCSANLVRQLWSFHTNPCTVCSSSNTFADGTIVTEQTLIFEYVPPFNFKIKPTDQVDQKLLHFSSDCCSCKALKLTSCLNKGIKTKSLSAQQMTTLGYVSVIL